MIKASVMLMYAYSEQTPDHDYHIMQEKLNIPITYLKGAQGAILSIVGYAFASLSHSYFNALLHDFCKNNYRLYCPQ